MGKNFFCPLYLGLIPGRPLPRGRGWLTDFFVKRGLCVPKMGPKGRKFDFSQYKWTFFQSDWLVFSKWKVTHPPPPGVVQIWYDRDMKIENFWDLDFTKFSGRWPQGWKLGQTCHGGVIWPIYGSNMQKLGPKCIWIKIFLGPKWPHFRGGVRNFERPTVRDGKFFLNLSKERPPQGPAKP